MATALPRKDSDTVTGRITRFETATETMADYIGYLRNEIRDEKKNTLPDQARIAALDEQCWAVVNERKAITFENEALIRKALYVYAPFMKALRSGS